MSFYVNNHFTGNYNTFDSLYLAILTNHRLLILFLSIIYIIRNLRKLHQTWHTILSVSLIISLLKILTHDVKSQIIFINKQLKYQTKPYAILKTEKH